MTSLIQRLLSVDVNCDHDCFMNAPLFAEAAAALSAEQARAARLVEALKATAEQALAAEIPVGYGPEDKGQWTKGYDAAIRHARAAITEAEQNKPKT